MKRMEDEYDDAGDRAADEEAAAVLTECPETVDEEDVAVADGEVDPVALDQGKYDFRPLSQPFPVMETDFQSGPAKLTSTSTLEVQMHHSGEAVAVLAWVTLGMDSDGDIRLTTCPRALVKEAKLDGVGVFRAGNWALRCMQFDAPLAVKKGDILVLDVAVSDGKGVAVRCNVAESAARSRAARAADPSPTDVDEAASEASDDDNQSDEESAGQGDEESDASDDDASGESSDQDGDSEGESSDDA